MAEYDGPYEIPDTGGNPIFPNGNTCPTLWAITKEGMVKGPAYVLWNDTAAQWSFGCNEPTTINWMLHSIRTTANYGSSVSFTFPTGWRAATSLTVRIAAYYTLYYIPQPRDVYGNTINGGLTARVVKNIVKLPYELYGKDAWSFDFEDYESQYLFVTNYDPGAPEGTSYDPEWGTYLPDPGFIWDPVTETYVTADCIKIESLGDASEGEKLRFRIYKGTEEPVTKDINVYLSYTGSVATEWVDFNPQSSITIEKGQFEVILEIETKLDGKIEGPERVSVSIAIDPESGEKVCTQSGTAAGMITDTVQEGNTLGECCKFVPKDYILWKENCEERLQGWMLCNGFGEAKYYGNTLKDGTILEE